MRFDTHTHTQNKEHEWEQKNEKQNSSFKLFSYFKTGKRSVSVIFFFHRFQFKSTRVFITENKTHIYNKPAAETHTRVNSPLPTYMHISNDVPWSSLDPTCNMSYTELDKFCMRCHLSRTPPLASPSPFFFHLFGWLLWRGDVNGTDSGNRSGFCHRLHPLRAL